MSSTEQKQPFRALWIGLLLFLSALVLRVLLLQSLPDPSGAHNPYYSGDTPISLDHARAIQTSRPFDLGLPLRPPGVARLVAWLWNGQGSGLRRTDFSRELALNRG